MKILFVALLGFWCFSSSYIYAQSIDFCPAANIPPPHIQAKLREVVHAYGINHSCLRSPTTCIASMATPHKFVGFTINRHYVVVWPCLGPMTTFTNFTCYSYGKCNAYSF